MLDEPTIDKSVLTHSNANWKKVAMVIALVTRDLDSDETDYSFDVANRIEVLVAMGKLEVRGNIKNWRFSEVRHPELKERGGVFL